MLADPVEDQSYPCLPSVVQVCIPVAVLEDVHAFAVEAYLESVESLEFWVCYLGGVDSLLDIQGACAVLNEVFDLLYSVPSQPTYIVLFQVANVPVPFQLTRHAA